MPASATLACLFVFLLQGLATLVDEFYYHHRRGLGRWEVVGHPLDTATVLLAFTYLLATRPGVFELWIYAGLAGFSCLFVTKDEFVHRLHCEAGEQWLHAVLFVLHPVVFTAAGLLWWNEAPRSILFAQAALVASFGIYQVLYWRSRGETRAREQ